MTATVADLLRVLDRQVHDLGITTERDTASGHVAGWMRLATTTRYAISLLPLGGRSAQVKAGLRTVLNPLVHGPRDPLVNPLPAPGLIRTSRTMGAIADVLTEHLRGGGRGDQIGTEAIKLEASMLSAVHVLARWSRAVTASQRFPGTTGTSRHSCPTSSSSPNHSPSSHPTGAPACWKTSDSRTRPRPASKAPLPGGPPKRRWFCRSVTGSAVGRCRPSPATSPSSAKPLAAPQSVPERQVTSPRPRRRAWVAGSSKRPGTGAPLPRGPHTSASPGTRPPCANSAATCATPAAPTPACATSEPQ